MRDRDREIAVKFNILDKCQSLESQLLGLPYVTDVELDLSGIYDGLDEVYILIGYDSTRYTLKYIMIGLYYVFLRNHLYPTGDIVEDYGKHLYFVRKIDDTWKVGDSHE